MLSSPSRQPHSETHTTQRFGDSLAVVPLDLNGAVLHGPARAAQPLQPARDLGELFVAPLQTGDHRDRLAAALFAVPRDPHDSVARSSVLGRAVFANAAGQWTLTIGAALDAAVIDRMAVR